MIIVISRTEFQVKILHINTNDYGGAATAIIRIHLALLEKGIDSKILFLKKTKEIPQTYGFHSWHQTNRKASLLRRIFKKLFSVLKPADNKKALIRSKLSKV